MDAATRPKDGAGRSKRVAPGRFDAPRSRDEKRTDMHKLRNLPWTHRVGAGIAVALLIGVPPVLIGGAAGAVAGMLPTFPNNLNVFPNRDFVSIDGYSEYA